MVQITETTYTLYVPIKLGKEREFLERLEKKGVYTEATSIPYCANGVEISISESHLRCDSITIEQYIAVLEKHAKKFIK